MSEKELLLIIRDILALAVHGGTEQLKRHLLEVDLRKVEQALSELEHGSAR